MNRQYVYLIEMRLLGITHYKIASTPNELDQEVDAALTMEWKVKIVPMPLSDAQAFIKSAEDQVSSIARTYYSGAAQRVKSYYV